MELPVITTDHTGCKDLVKEGVNGYICKKLDKFELAQKMEQMLFLREEELIKMGSKGRQIVLQRYAVEFVNKNYQRLITSIFKNTGSKVSRTTHLISD
jgi:glycosyltransferase involved in cell wall biosynthesis